MGPAAPGPQMRVRPDQRFISPPIPSIHHGGRGGMPQLWQGQRYWHGGILPGVRPLRRGPFGSSGGRISHGRPAAYHRRSTPGGRASGAPATATTASSAWLSATSTGRPWISATSTGSTWISATPSRATCLPTATSNIRPAAPRLRRPALRRPTLPTSGLRSRSLLRRSPGDVPAHLPSGPVRKAPANPFP